MQTSKIRHQFYLPGNLSERLEALAARPGASKTNILTAALRAWLDRKAGDELDERFGPRFDRQTRASHRLEQNLDQVAAMLDLFIAHQLMLAAHQPAFDDATTALGRARYNAFMAQVARQLKARSAQSIPDAPSDD